MVKQRFVTDVKPRVLMVAQLFMPSVGGGSENQAILLSRRIMSRGFKVTALARRVNEEPKESIMDNIRVIRLRNINWSLIRRGEEGFLLGLISNFSYAFSLAVYLISCRNNFDIIHFFGAGFPTAFTAPVAKLLGKKSLVHVTGLAGVEAGSIGEGRFSWLKRPFIWMINFVDLFRASGSAIENGLIKDGIGKMKIIRIPNLVDTNIFRPIDFLAKNDLRKKLELPLEGKIGVFSGILIKSKGVDFLLKVWKMVSETKKDLYLIILGDGPYMKHLDDLSTALGISEKVRFTGIVKNVNEYLQASDIFVFPSSHPEGTPNAVLEAMACGLPVITTKAGNLEDFIEDGVNGIFMDINNMEDCVRRLQVLLSDETLCRKLSDNAPRTIKKNNDPELVSQKYIDLYNQLILE